MAVATIHAALEGGDYERARKLVPRPVELSTAEKPIPTTCTRGGPRAAQLPEHRERVGDGTPAASVLAEVHVREAHSRWLGEPLSMPLEVLLELRLRRQIALPHPTRREPHHLDQVPPDHEIAPLEA